MKGTPGDRPRRAKGRRWRCIMAKQMGNSGRGPKDKDDAEERRFAQGGSQGGPVLGEGEKVGEWSADDEEDEEIGIQAGSSADEEEEEEAEGLQAKSGANRPSESERPPGGRDSR